MIDASDERKSCCLKKTVTVVQNLRRVCFLAGSSWLSRSLILHMKESSARELAWRCTGLRSSPPPARPSFVSQRLCPAAVCLRGLLAWQCFAQVECFHSPKGKIWTWHGNIKVQLTWKAPVKLQSERRLLKVKCVGGYRRQQLFRLLQHHCLVWANIYTLLLSLPLSLSLSQPVYQLFSFPR